MNKKLIKMSMVSILAIFIVISAVNVRNAYDEPLIETEKVIDNDYRFQMTFDHQATLYNNDLYGPITFKRDVYFTELVRLLNVSFDLEFVHPETDESFVYTDYNCYVTLTPKNKYWQKTFPVIQGNETGDFKRQFSINLTEYRNLTKRIEKQTVVPVSGYEIVFVAEINTTAEINNYDSVHREIAPSLSFDMNRKIVKPSNKTQIIEADLFYKEVTIPTDAKENRKDSLVLLYLSVFGFIVGTIVIIKGSSILQHKRKFISTDKSVTGMDQGGIFYIDDPKNLSKIAKLEGKQILFDSGSKEWFFRAEGKEYRSKKL